MLKPQVSQFALVFLAVCAAFVGMKLAEQVLAPIVLGLVIGIVFAPFSDLLERIGLPQAISGLVTILITLVLIVGLLFTLEPTVRALANRVPAIWKEMQTTVSAVRDVLQDVEEASENLTDAIGNTDPDLNPKGANRVEQDDGAIDVVASQSVDANVAMEDRQHQGDEVDLPGVGTALSYAPSVAAQLLITIGTLYFFLISRHDIYEWSQRLSRQVAAVDLNAAEKQVSRYFLTITLINAALGTLVGAALMAIGMPWPWLWGFCAFVANFILYLGPVFFLVSLMVGGIVAFDGLFSFAPPALYFLLNSIEAQFVTPTLVGKAMALNPLFVFVSLVFWLWLWGPLGGIIAIPLSVWLVEIYKCFDRERKASDQLFGETKERAAEPTGLR